MIKAGIFDVGGVLHTDELTYVWKDITDTLQISLEEFNKAKEDIMDEFQKGKISESDFWKVIIDRTHAKGSLPKESLYGREFKKRFTEKTDVLHLAEKLKKEGYKLAVLSNNIDAHYDVANKVGLFDLFDVKVFSQQVGLAKPEKEIYVYTLNQLQVTPEEAFFTDDTEINVVAANKIGIHGIHFVNEKDLEQKLKKLEVRL